MSGTVGNTTYHDLNVDMLNGEMKVGATAENVDKAYKKTTASLCKRIFVGIITLGVYSIYHAVKDSTHSKQLKNLSAGTENLYKGLSTLTKSDSETRSMKINMFGETVTLSKDESERYWATFADKSKEEIKNPSEVLHKIERDVMEHSELFNKSLVVDNILNKYEKRIDAGTVNDDTAQFFHDVRKLSKNADAVHNNFAYDNLRMNDVAALYSQRNNLKPMLVRAKDRYDELLSVLFTSRLGLDPAETSYIDRKLGKKLAKNVMDGTITTAADARSFINRNASACHFTTVEGARIYDQFEKALSKESGYDHSIHANEEAVSTKSIQFKDGYYQPKPNPVLPSGDIKEVHDFVSNLISDSNVNLLDKDRDTDANFEGKRLRNLIYENRKLVGKLMENRAQVKADPSKLSLLATIDPKIRAALEEQLDKLNEDYDRKVSVKQKKYDDLSESLNKELNKSHRESDGYINDLKKRKQDAESELNFLTSETGRADYLREVIRDQEKEEKKLRGQFGTNDINDVHDDELVIINDDKHFKENVEEAKDDIFYLENRKDEIGLGLNFFGDAEKKINKAITDGCAELQNEVTKLINDVFPNAPKTDKTSLEQINNSSLTDIIGTPAQDNQLQLIKKALEIYFKEMPEMDQRAMMAAGTRFCANSENASPGARLGAILKGAGPVMQKMLQSLDPSMFANHPDFMIALEDMKDKLAPIDQKVIHAQLYNIVKNSKGSIKGITVDKALGAASVAQALKCTINYSDGTSKNCVVKILRPDAAMKAQREEKVFNNAAKMVGNGMDVTFKGQFARIMDEMDLRTEAENVRRGNQVYDYSKSGYNKNEVRQTYGSFANVHSMKLVDGIEPDINTMVLELVPGETLEDYVRDASDESIKIASETKTEIQNRGEDNAADLSLQAARKLTNLYEDVKGKYEALVNLSYMWTNEGLFAEGFYHGDIHMGNIMTSPSFKMSPDEVANDPNKGVTLIDFGNASKLTQGERANVVKVVAGTATGDSKLFAEGFRELLSPDSRTKFDNAGAELVNKLQAVFSKGGLNDTAARLSAALKLMQREYNIEVPGPVHNFLESQKRLQVAMDSTLSVMNAIAAEREKIISPHLDNLSEEDKTEMKESIKSAKKYKPSSMIKSITDVVRQNLFSAMKSIGGVAKAKQCYDKIKNDLEENQNQANVLEV